MDLAVVWESLPRLLGGAALTLEITLVSVLTGLCVAVPLVVARLSRNPMLWMPVYVYILYFRGTPLLVQLFTDGWSGYPGLPDHDHQPKVVGATPAHLVLIWIHRVFSNLKRWALGTFHGLRRAHLRRYLDEFVFRWNRRRHTATAFDTLLGIGARLRPADYRDIVGQRV